MTDNLPAINADSLIAQGIDKGVPVETLERLLAMRKEILEDQAKEAFYEALTRFQSECPTIKKTKEVKGNNGSVRYRYESIDGIVKQVSPTLKLCGLSYTINTDQTEELITAICTIHHVQGFSKESKFSVPIEKEAYMNDAQKSGSALSYAKRYAFCNALGIMTTDQDDDAQSLGAQISPQEIYKKCSEVMRATIDNISSVITIADAIDRNELDVAVEAFYELDDEVKKLITIAPSKGGPFTTNQRTVFKSNEWVAARNNYFGENNG